MKVYCVGGALRDEMLGQPVQDRDWVVVGATPDELIAQGYMPVGKDFPVFLHPRSHEEYALARTERKTGPGYRGFAVHFDAGVTLEDDLLRRDLTINAMARGEDGVLVDPYGGRQDVQNKVFRHVSPAFAEDPVRVLRLARFAARFADFSTAPETLQLMRHMVASGELAALVPERVWQEVARGLMARQPSRMFDLLDSVGALRVVSPALAALWQQAGLAARVDKSATRGLSLEQRFAVLAEGLGEAVTSFCEAWRVPVECRDLAQLLGREKGGLFAASDLSAEDLVGLLERVDAKRKPERFMALLAAAQTLQAFDESRLLNARLALAAVDEAAIAKAQAHPRDIKQAIHAARVQAVAAMA